MTVGPQATQDVIDVITGGWRAQALYTAVKLGIPDLIEDGRAGAREIAAATGAAEEGIHRLMRLLVAMKLFEGDRESGYRNTPASAALVEGPRSLRDMCLLHGEQYYTAWGHCVQAISTVSSGFEPAYGRPFYAYLGEDPEVAERFQHTMNAGNLMFDGVPQAIDFSGRSVVDIGGGGGQLLGSILAATPDAHGTLFDREHMIPEARAHLDATVGPGRAELVAGDMFQEVPGGADVYILCRVLAGWSDDEVVGVFENCRRAMKDPSARLIVIDRLVVDEGSTVLPALWDLHLLVITGGRHRTRDSFTALLDRAGFDVERAAELPMENTALIAAPRATTQP